MQVYSSSRRFILLCSLPLTQMILLHTLLVVLTTSLLLAIQTSAHTIDTLSERSSTSQPDALECSVAPHESFDDKAGTRHQLIPVGPTDPIGTVQTYQNSAIFELLTFRVGISAISEKGIELTIVSFKSGHNKAPPNSITQMARYRLNLADRKGHTQETILWLKGYDKCKYTIKDPVNIDGKYTLNVVVMNTV